MTETEQAEADAAILALTSRGYVPIDEANGVKVGSRVRNYGEQFREAYQNGTGNVLAILERPDSFWAHKYGRPDIEIVVFRDRPDRRGVGTWADYGTQLARVQP